MLCASVIAYNRGVKLTDGQDIESRCQRPPKFELFLYCFLMLRIEPKYLPAQDNIKYEAQSLMRLNSIRTIFSIECLKTWLWRKSRKENQMRSWTKLSGRLSRSTLLILVSPRQRAVWLWAKWYTARALSRTLSKSWKGRLITTKEAVSFSSYVKVKQALSWRCRRKSNMSAHMHGTRKLTQSSLEWLLSCRQRCNV